jgi:hypothetical protein
MWPTRGRPANPSTCRGKAPSGRLIVQGQGHGRGQGPRTGSGPPPACRRRAPAPAATGPSRIVCLGLVHLSVPRMIRGGVGPVWSRGGQRDPRPRRQRVPASCRGRVWLCANRITPRRRPIAARHITWPAATVPKACARQPRRWSPGTLWRAPAGLCRALGAARTADTTHPLRRAKAPGPERLGRTGADVHARHPAPVVARDAQGTHDGHGGDPSTAPDPERAGVDPQVRAVRCDRASGDVVDGSVDLPAQPADVARRPVRPADRLDHIVGGSRRDPGNDGPRGDRREPFPPCRSDGGRPPPIPAIRRGSWKPGQLRRLRSLGRRRSVPARVRQDPARRPRPGPRPLAPLAPSAVPVRLGP